MEYITLFICIVSFILSLHEYKSKILNPLTLFYGMWSVIVFLSILNLYDIYKPSTEAYGALMIMLLFFMVGSLVGKYIKLSFNKHLSFNKTAISYINLKLFYFLSALFIIFASIDCLIVLQGYIKHVPAYIIRSWRLAPYGSNNPMLNRRSFAEEILRSIIVSPFESLIYPIAAYSMLIQKNKNSRYIITISILSLILSSFAGGGGRFNYLYIVGCILLACIISVKNKNVSKQKKRKYKKVVLFSILLCLIVVMFFTSLRTGKGNFVKQAYTYFALPPTLLSIWLKELKNVPHTYGMLSTFGIHSYFFRLLQAIKMDFLVPQVYNTAFQHILNAEKFRDVGYTVASAFVTPIYYFYIDGGYIFTAFMSMFCGYIVSHIYIRCINNMDIKNFTYYCLIMYVVFLTFCRFQLCMPGCVISFVLLRFLFKNRKPKKDVNNV